MPTHHDNKARRTARWERKHRKDDRDRAARDILRQRAQERRERGRCDDLIRHADAQRVDSDLVAAAEKLSRIARRLKLLKGDHLSRPGYVRRDNPYAIALAAFAAHSRRWLRDPADFRAHTHNPQRQFTQLAQHLFAEYAPPACFESAWFVTHKRKARLQQDWYIRLGAGQSPRALPGLPIELTRRAAHALHDAPPDLTLDEAFRWAQIIGMGGSRPAARAILASPIGTNFRRDKFWLTVVRFLVDRPMLNPALIGPIVDYIHQQRHVPQLIDGRDDLAPPQPNFSMKGRSTNNLLARVNAWHAHLAQGHPNGRRLTWRTCRVPGMTWTEGDGPDARRYVIRELLDSNHLVNEGRLMNHCVATYASTCATGFNAIYTLSVETRQGVQKLITLRVDPHRKAIVEARGKSNREVRPLERRIMGQWAQRAGLEIAQWL